MFEAQWRTYRSAKQQQQKTKKWVRNAEFFFSRMKVLSVLFERKLRFLMCPAWLSSEVFRDPLKGRMRKPDLQRCTAGCLSERGSSYAACMPHKWGRRVFPGAEKPTFPKYGGVSLQWHIIGHVPGGSTSPETSLIEDIRYVKLRYVTVIYSHRFSEKWILRINLGIPVNTSRQSKITYENM